MGYQTWVRNNVTNATGTGNLAWPTLSNGGNGWWCMQGCLLQCHFVPAGSKSGGDIRRNLATYVQSLKNVSLTPATVQQAIGNAVIVGIKSGRALATAT